jgi:hypothetical protein
LSFSLFSPAITYIIFAAGIHFLMFIYSHNWHKRDFKRGCHILL